MLSPLSSLSQTLPTRTEPLVRPVSSQFLDIRENQQQLSPKSPGNLSPEEQQRVRELQKRDREVRRHEQAHLAAGGNLVTGPFFEFVRGPDGRQYAVGGSVNIDTQAVPGDPQATIQKMDQVQRAALAPASPSPQDRRVSREAAQKEAQARQELREAEQQSLSSIFENINQQNLQTATNGSATPSKSPSDSADTLFNAFATSTATAEENVVLNSLVRESRRIEVIPLPFAV